MSTSGSRLPRPRCGVTSTWLPSRFVGTCVPSRRVWSRRASRRDGGSTSRRGGPMDSGGGSCGSRCASLGSRPLGNLLDLAVGGSAGPLTLPSPPRRRRGSYGEPSPPGGASSSSCSVMLRQRGPVLRRPPRLGRLLVRVGDGDQLALAPRAPHEGDAERQ